MTYCALISNIDLWKGLAIPCMDIWLRQSIFCVAVLVSLLVPITISPLTIGALQACPCSMHQDHRLHIHMAWCIQIITRRNLHIHVKAVISIFQLLQNLLFWKAFMVVFNIHNAKQPQLSQSIRTLHLSKPRVRHHVPPCPVVWLRHAEGRSCSMAILLKPRFQLVHFLTLHNLRGKYDARNATTQCPKQDTQGCWLSYDKH